MSCNNDREPGKKITCSGYFRAKNTNSWLEKTIKDKKKNNLSTHWVFPCCFESPFYVYLCVDSHSFLIPVMYFRLKWTGLLDAQWSFTFQLKYSFLLGVSFCKYGSYVNKSSWLSQSAQLWWHFNNRQPVHVRMKTIDQDQFTNPRNFILTEKPAESTNIKYEMYQLSSFTTWFSITLLFTTNIWQFSVVTNVIFSSNAAIIFFFVHNWFTYKLSCGSGLLL